MPAAFHDLVVTLYTRGRVVQQLLVQRQEGQALVEYVLILALISVVAVATLTILGKAIVTRLDVVQRLSEVVTHL